MLESMAKKLMMPSVGDSPRCVLHDKDVEKARDEIKMLRDTEDDKLSTLPSVGDSPTTLSPRDYPLVRSNYVECLSSGCTKCNTC